MWSCVPQRGALPHHLQSGLHGLQNREMISRSLREVFSRYLEYGNAYVIPTRDHDIKIAWTCFPNTGEILFPYFAGSLAESMFHKAPEMQGPTTLLKGYQTKDANPRRTIITLLREGITYNGNTLGKVTTNAGEVYYLGTGLMLDKSFNPLFIGTCRYKWNGEDWDRIGNVIFVDYRIFSQDDRLCKNLRKSIIPDLSQSYEIRIIDLSNCILRAETVAPSDLRRAVELSAEQIANNLL